MTMRASIALFLLSGAKGLVLPRGAPATQLARAHPTIPPLVRQTASRVAPLCMAEPEPSKGKLPFFLDIGTKGGIVFYSIVGTVLPFVAYSYMVDVMDLGVVVAGNVILVLYVGLGMVVWTGR